MVRNPLACPNQLGWLSDLFCQATDFIPVAADRTHARIIWDCAWAPDDSYFVTVSRDKQLKTWSAMEGNGEIWKQLSSTKLKESVTAVDIIRDGTRDRLVSLWK
jgi:elongator complex protein 2